MSRLAQDMKKLAHRAGGSHKTVHDREQMAQRFARHLLAQNIQVTSTCQLKARHIAGYIHEWLAQGISLRTLQNEMAMVRSILAEAGRTQLSQSELISNQSLGISGASCDGTHRAIPDALYHQVLDRVHHIDAGLAASLQLARVMGLRGQEAVQCCQSLKTWDKQLEKGAERLPVIFGTKGGRPRMTQVTDREAVRQAVKEALGIAGERNGHLIDKPDLKSAMDYWHNHLRDTGLTGEYSPHSLRYAWAQDAIRYY
ncbi:TPA: integrase domain-containing protein, partial [Salmonella enterica subsp. enterica serovar Typhimurium]